MRYWLDADVLISANNGPYPVNNAHGFWSWMDKEIKTGRIAAAERTFNEVVSGRKNQDDLARWMKLRKSNGIAVKSSKEVDGKLAQIGDYVGDNPQYPIHQKLEFYRGADASVIAHAWQDEGTVVSNESGHFPKSERVRIPDVCHHFQVRCITRDALIKEIDAKF